MPFSTPLPTPLLERPYDVMWMFADYPRVLAGREIHCGVMTIFHKESWWADSGFYILIILSALASAMVRSAFWRFVVVPFARAMGVENSAKRLEESLMQVLFYSMAWTYNTIFLLRQDWFWYPILTFLDGFPKQPVDDAIWWFYGIQIGWYTYCLYATIFLDIRKSDYWLLIVHHFVTLSLQYSAFVTGYFRVGMLVMFSMDICDVFIFSAKALKILDYNCRAPKVLYALAYTSLPTVWLAFRLIYFPYVVLGTTMIGTIKLFSWEGADGWAAFNALLSILLVLNVYWFYQIVQIGILSLRKGGAQSLDDIREVPVHANTPPNRRVVKSSHPITSKRSVRKGKAKVAL